MPTNHRRLAAITGALYLVTFVTSFPALMLKTPFLAGATDPTGIRWAIVLEIVLALSCVGTAVAIYPVTRRFNHGLALGFVASRLLEASIILAGVLAMLALVTVRAAGAVGGTLVALHAASFLVGPGVFAAVNALLLGTVLYRARLVPRIIPIVGLIGAPLLAASVIATVFGSISQLSPIGGLAALPIALWELSLGLWLLVRGFRTVEPA